MLNIVKYYCRYLLLYFYVESPIQVVSTTTDVTCPPGRKQKTVQPIVVGGRPGLSPSLIRVKSSSSISVNNTHSKVGKHFNAPVIEIKSCEKFKFVHEYISYKLSVFWKRSCTSILKLNCILWKSI